MTWPKPSHFSEEAMTDRLVEEHGRGEHATYAPIGQCPLCFPPEGRDREDDEEFWEERGIGIKR